MSKLNPDIFIRLYTISALIVFLQFSSSCRTESPPKEAENLPPSFYTDQEFYRIKNDLLHYMKERDHYLYMERMWEDTMENMR